MKKKRILFLLPIGMALCVLSAAVIAESAGNNEGMNMYVNSDFIEKEQPELTEETKQLISLYQKEPTEENYQNLREIVIKNYNAVLDRKEEKLSELREETSGKPGGEEIVSEMEEIVQEMYITYWDRINSSMLRFTDPRLLKWNVADAPQYEYIPVMGAGESIYISRTTVTNVQYAEYIKATGAEAPSNWTEGNYPSGEDEYPVNYVSYQDAEEYCAWLTEKDGVNTYRLPSEGEWELAAGHMPKDADFNCGADNGRTSVEKYAEVTRGAHGAVDFWGNVWEWTSTERGSLDGTTRLGVKGGSWSSDRTDCRTEYREEGRNASNQYEDVGFRVIQVLNGEEPVGGESEVIPAETGSSMAVYEHNGMKYWLYTPDNAQENLPLVVYLHGVNGKSSDPDKLIEKDGFTKWLHDGLMGEVSAYVLIPQLSSIQKDWIEARESVISLIDEVAGAYTIDKANISLTGFSMGGAGTWSIGACYPEKFARIAPLSGGIRLTDKVLSSLSTISIRVFVGTADTVITPQSARDCVEALTERNADVTITEYEGAAHTEVPEKAYLEGDLLNWLIRADS